MKKIDLEQGSSDWLEFRRTRIGASELPIILGESPWKTPKRLWEEKLLFRSLPVITPAMQDGINLESIARGVICDRLGFSLDPVVCQHEEISYLIASLDGLNEENEIFCEIKCPGMKTHLMAEKGEIPTHYEWQIEHQFLVTGLSNCIYASYNPNYVENPLILIRRSVNLDQHNFILEKTKEFWECLQNIIPPKKRRKGEKNAT